MMECGSGGVGFLTQRREDAECAERSRVWELRVRDCCDE